MNGRFLRTSYVVASVAGIGFFAMSVALLGIWPARVLDDETRRMAPEHPLGLSASEQRGRVIYGREGCAYCHSQQVRYLESDMKRFGAPTLAWETRLDYPQLWGTRRIGPDLAREGSTHSSDWQMAHLYGPRTVVPDSVMPAYAGLFEGSAERPTQDAQDLLAYLESLGRAREIAAPDGEARAMAACNCANDEMAMMAFHAQALNANPAKTRRQGMVPKISAQMVEGADTVRGNDLYAHNCAGCHGRQGQGDGRAAAALHPRPANLAEHTYSADRLIFAMWNGVDGTSMPAWRDFSQEDLAALAKVVASFHTAQNEPEPPANIQELGARVYTENCAQCHGEYGAGDGTAVSELRVVPTDFLDARPSVAQALRALRNGVDGTQMAPWTGRLSEEELSAVAYYVRRIAPPAGRKP